MRLSASSKIHFRSMPFKRCMLLGNSEKLFVNNNFNIYFQNYQLKLKLILSKLRVGTFNEIHIKRNLVILKKMSST